MADRTDATKEVTNKAKKWSVWKTLFIFPLFPLGVVIAMCVWAFIDDMTSPPRIIDGHADDAVYYGAPIVIFLVLICYGAYAAPLGLVWMASAGAAPSTPPGR